jgi:hypothetical protein
MRGQDWIFTVRYGIEGGTRDRWAVVGPACASTVETALHLASVPEALRAKIRACQVVRDFVDGRIGPEKSVYYSRADADGSSSWVVCIGSVQDVLPNEARRPARRA